MYADVCSWQFAYHFVLCTWVESSNVDKLPCWRTKVPRRWWDSKPGSQRESRVNTPIYHDTSSILILYDVKHSLNRSYVKTISMNRIIGIWDLFIIIFFRGGGEHFGSYCPNSRQPLKISMSGSNVGGGGGGGGGPLVYVFFAHPKLDIILYPSIGVGVQELLQVTLDKIFRTSKKKMEREKKAFPDSLPELYSTLPE